MIEEQQCQPGMESDADGLTARDLSVRRENISDGALNSSETPRADSLSAPFNASAEGVADNFYFVISGVILIICASFAILGEFNDDSFLAFPQLLSPQC